MSNDVQTHEEVAAQADGANRRNGVRHAAGSLGSVTARIIGGSQVDLVNFSSRGILFECDSRLLIGARASVRITTADANMVVTGRVVRSRVKGLVNGALRYDAALALDNDLTLSPAILAAVPAAADELVSFESEFEDPSPVEAYVAESEASLLEVVATDLPIADAIASVAVERPAHSTEEAAAAESTGAAAGETGVVAIAAESTAAPLDAEPIAFEADGDIAFEPSAEFVFDDAEAEAAAEFSFEDSPAQAAVFAMDGADTHPPAVDSEPVAEPAGASMFDSTYIPPVYETEYGGESQFEVTPPSLVAAATATSFFDARPSEAYGVTVATSAVEAVRSDAETPVAVMTGPTAQVAVEPGEAALDGGVDFESEVAFEAVDAALLEASFDELPALPAQASDAPVEAVDAPVDAIDLTVSVTLEPLSAEAASVVQDGEVPAAVDEPIETPAAVDPTEDRVLLQFAATVPHDLADLRRIAADNQW